MESKKSKLKRFTAFAFLGVIVALLALPIGGAIGQTISGHGSSRVLQANSETVYAVGISGGENYALPFASTNGTATVTTERSVNVSGVVSIAYMHTIFLVTNATLLQLNEHAVNKWTSAIDMAGNFSVSLGSGVLNGTAISGFAPIARASETGGNASSLVNVSFSLSAASLTGPSGNVMILEIQDMSNFTTMQDTNILIGNSGSAPWYLAGESSAYVFGGLLLFGFAFMTLPFHDFSITKAREMIPKKKNYPGKLIKMPPKKQVQQKRKGGK